MGVLRFIAVVFVFAAVSVAWMVLGTVTHIRTIRQDDSLSQEMTSLWGPRVVVQPAPYWAPGTGGGDGPLAAPASSTVTADITHEKRQKGLLWYSTFAVTFSGTYGLEPAAGGKAQGRFRFDLPAGINRHEALKVTVDGQEVAVPADQRMSGRLSVPLDRDGPHSVTVSFKTFGLSWWLYTAGDPGMVLPSRGGDGGEQVVSAGGPRTELKDFSLTITTDFRDIDYPKGTQSPTSPAEPASEGVRAVWKYASLVTNQAMGVVVPKRPDGGPIIARMSFFAPVSLFFFFTALFTVVVLKKVPLHPMHYLFIAAGFFAFHILLAYVADLMPVQAAFWICAGVSVFLVVSYMRLVAGVRFALTYVAAAQLVYLIGFTYAFFWKGRTGLTVTIGAVLTLFVLMQATGRVKWHEAFRGTGRRQPARAPAPDAPGPPPPPAGDQAAHDNA